MPRTLHARLDRSIRTRLHTLYEARDTLGVRRDAESLHAHAAVAQGSWNWR